MRYDPERHHRRSIRLTEYDYTRTGAYFVTICAWQRECLFGEIVAQQSELSEAGRLVQQAWYDLPARYPNVRLDAFIVMPNHVHGILLIAPREQGVPEQPAGHKAPTLGEVLRAYKSISALAVNRLLGRSERPVWQRNYHEHIVRDNKALDDIRQYILLNPSRWPADPDNPVHVSLNPPATHGTTANV